MDKSEILNSMIGKTFVSVTQEGDDRIVFDDGQKMYVMYHEQDCCEDVVIESIVGDLQDLVGTPLLMAEEAKSEEISENDPDGGCGSTTWTFYKFASIRGYVDVRWIGTSNGFYSEEAHMKIVK